MFKWVDVTFGFGFCANPGFFRCSLRMFADGLYMLFESFRIAAYCLCVLRVWQAIPLTDPGNTTRILRVVV